MIIALVLLSALLHATWNAVLRVQRERDQVLAVAISIATLFATVVAVVRWQLGAVPFTSLRGVGFTIAAGVAETLYFATLTRAMAIGPLGVVYTISRGGAVVAVWPLSIAWMGEVATLPAIAGSAVVIGGLALCGIGGRAQGTTGDRRAAVAWAMACAVAIAGYHLAYKAALLEGTNPSACFALSLGVSAVLGVARLGDARRTLGAVVRGRGLQMIGMGVLCGGSFLILMEALAIGGSGFVLTLRNTSVLFAVVLAWRIGERPSRAEIIGAVLVAAGAALMTR